MFSARIYITQEPIIKLILTTILLLTILNARASLCSNGGAPNEIGVLDHKIINEASGLAVSKLYPGRLYHVNDSGDGPYFYITNYSGEQTQQISIENFIPQDVEDLAVGRCGDTTCLYIADIGDNREERSHLEVVLITERELFSKKVKAKQTIKFKYPDGAHNVEGFSVHPNGDLFIITKSVNYVDNKAGLAIVYKLTQSQMANHKKFKLMKEIGSIELPFLLSSYDVYGQIVTAFDFSPKGDKFLILTYRAAIEFNFDLATQTLPAVREMKQGKDFKIIDLPGLPQQESIAYLPGGEGFLYNTEFHEEHGSAPIKQVNCIGNP